MGSGEHISIQIGPSDLVNNAEMAGKTSMEIALGNIKDQNGISVVFVYTSARQITTTSGELDRVAAVFRRWETQCQLVWDITRLAGQS